MRQPKQGESWQALSGLWLHQRRALECLDNYLNSECRKAALIHMPTGTGKSGVIAILAQHMPKVGHVLLLTPWVTLRRQLRDDVDMKTSQFWKIVLPSKSVADKPVLQVLPGSLKVATRGGLQVSSVEESGTIHILDKVTAKPTVLVSTIQGLQWLHRHKERSEYQILRELISLVVVDEGHYEPAPDWAQAVRDLVKPTVLFTATPYRNDLKLFDVDERFIYIFTYHQAVKERYIRNVKFQDATATNPDRFVEELLKFFHGEFQKLKPHPKSKVIVRCRTEQTVNWIAKLLYERGESVIGIHENFSSRTGQPFLVKVVPDPRKTDVVFWVHQFKLMEGIDDPSFCLLAIYDGFGNTRALVQQIGRVIRNPSTARNKVAYVFAHPRSEQRERWQNYEFFETACESDPGYLRSLRRRSIHQKLLEIQPEITYFLRDFRPAFNPHAPSLQNEFLFVLSTNVYELHIGFSDQHLRTSLLEFYRNEDREVMPQDQPHSVIPFWTYVVCRNSPVLRNTAFVEGELGYTIYRRIGRLLFYYDTHGGTPDYLSKNGKPVDAGRLQRLFEERSGNRLFQLSLNNTDTGVHSIRTKTLRARDLGATAPGISDHAHYLSTASGYVQDDHGRRNRRYIGFSRGRVTELSLGRCGYDDYIKWIEYLAKEIQKTKAKPLAAFERYAEFADVPEDPDTRNILLDLEDIKERYVKKDITEPGASRVNFDLDDICLDVEDGRFELLANGTPYEMRIVYDKSKDRYELSGTQLAEDYLDQEDMKHSLVAYLNLNQAFRVVPASTGYIYAHFNWYRPRLPILGSKKAGRIDFLKLFYPVSGLETIESEKGAKGHTAATDRWQSGSLFNLVDTMGAKTAFADFMKGTDILVCDDQGPEVADFILGNTKARRIVFLHAKANPKEKRRSTSAFSVVCFQALKNLEFLQPYNEKPPPNLPRWDYPWRDESIEGEVTRIRLPKTKKAAEVWSMISQIIRDPSASREVWLLLARGFSKGDFEDRLTRSKPAPADIQLIYGIQSTWNAIASIGAQFRIFCSP